VRGPPPQHQQSQEPSTQTTGTGFIPTPPSPPDAPVPPPRSPTPERARRNYNDDDTISGKATFVTYEIQWQLKRIGRLDPTVGRIFHHN